MKCYKCGGEYKEYNGTLFLDDDIIGEYKVHDVTYYKCETCDTSLYPKDTAKKIESVEAKIQNELIGQLPVNEFIVATEAAELLGISKQAFHKHRRIKNGFIYSVILGGKQLYNKKSVLLFKKTGDGRFKLPISHRDKFTNHPIIAFADFINKKVRQYTETDKPPELKRISWDKFSDKKSITLEDYTTQQEIKAFSPWHEKKKANPDKQSCNKRLH